jgi:hypothetical protein
LSGTDWVKHQQLPALDRRPGFDIGQRAGTGEMHTEDFSLVLGGPLYQLLLRSGFVRPPLDILGVRIAVITALAWLPLVPLAILNGRFLGGVQVPFLNDFEMQARLLVALPLMILAEIVVYQRMRALAAQFVERQIVKDDGRPAFEAVVASTMRLRNSFPIEIALLLLSVLVGPHVWQGALRISSDTWYASVSSSGLTLTPAGLWYRWVSIPVFQFILLRWYFRVFLWCRFLFLTSRLELNLVPTHPDRCCGLGFLGNVTFAFTPLLMAHTSLVAGLLANRIVYEGATLPDYKFELIAMGTFLVLLVFAPLCVFTPKLNRARHAGLRIYGRLASEYVVGFARKWTGNDRSECEPLVGSSDIQSLADLDASFAVVQQTRLVPVSKEALIRLLVVSAVPLTPLALTMFSLEELLRRLVNILF